MGQMCTRGPPVVKRSGSCRTDMVRGAHLYGQRVIYGERGRVNRHPKKSLLQSYGPLRPSLTRFIAETTISAPPMNTESLRGRCSVKDISYKDIKISLICCLGLILFLAGRGKTDIFKMFLHFQSILPPGRKDLLQWLSSE